MIVRIWRGWTRIEDTETFAEDDIERAAFYPQDDAFLIDREMTVKHFTVH